MRRPRVTIMRLMVAIAIAAAGLSAFRADLTDWRVYRIWHEYVIGVVPLACVLTYGLVIGSDDLIRLRRCRPFLVGFEVTGWAVLFAYASFLAVNFEHSRPLDCLYPLTRYTFGTPNLYYKDPKILAFHLFVLNAPEFALAVVGGWVAAWRRITVVRE